MAAKKSNGSAAPQISPLREWVSSVALRPPNASSVEFQLNATRCSMLRKLTVGFGIGKLLEHLRSSVSSHTQEELLCLCSVDNITVNFHADCSPDYGWEVCGVNMVSPPMSLQLSAGDFDSSSFFASCNEDDASGRDVHATFTSHSIVCCARGQQLDGSSSNYLCCAFGVLLRFIFSGECIDSESSSNPQEVMGCMGDFLRSLSISPDDVNLKSNKRRASSQEGQLSYYHVISRLVNDLLDCEQDEFCTLESAINDIHILLREPNRFLFNSNHRLSSGTKMYGRSTETTALLDAFCRVGTSRQSEAFMIKGFSGSGKTRLVQNLSGSVNAANGLLVSKKFEEGSSNQLSIALSAFDDLCILLAESLTVVEGGSSHLWREILSQFSTNLHVLVSTLPSVARLAPSPATTFSLLDNVRSATDVNFFSLCDIIKRFMRAVTKTSHTVMMFWDDLQWCDAVSLGLMHTVLSDNTGANSCLFFVGSYRDNEVSKDHILQGFFDWLSAFNVPINTVRLAGLPDAHILRLVSDSLGMLPRLCGSLAQVVYRKTEGNPFFVHTFLRSLVDKHMLTYSYREKCWVWDTTEIYAENITPNVLELLSSKLTNLSKDSKAALKVAACFGIKIRTSVAISLSRTDHYYTLVNSLNTAVDDGLMDLTSDSNESSYRFVHDKVREAAYCMIGQDERSQYHFDIGITLLNAQTGEESNDMIEILNQVNFGVPALLSSDTQRMSIARLNHEAALKMMAGSNYTSAYKLATKAVMLLPDDSWTVHYDLSLKFYFLLSKAAHSYSKMDEAKDALNKIIEHSNSASTKLDAYYFLYPILFNFFDPEEMGELLVTVVALLNSLGEDIPDSDVNKQASSIQIGLATSAFEKESEETLLHTSRLEESHQCQIDVMKAYSIAVNLAYVLKKPYLFSYFTARWGLYCLRFKVLCKFTAASYVSLAVALCQDVSNDKIRLGHRIGKLGLRLIHYAESAELPSLYLAYYGHVGILFEPIQACIDMHRKANENALQVGNTTLASLHKQFLTARLLHAGTNLRELQREIEHSLKISEQYYPVLGLKLNVYHKAVLTLIGPESPVTAHGLNKTSDFAIARDPSSVMSEMIAMTYLGYYERVKHIANQSGLLREKNESTLVVLHTVYVNFYYVLASICLHRMKNGNNRRVTESTKQYFDVIRRAADLSKWNFANKLALVLAERYSLSGNVIQAETQYNAAIEASKASHFTHEEGLACELAGYHYERLGNTTKALALFQQAERCYECWGSMVKTRQMAHKITHLMDECMFKKLHRFTLSALF